MINLFLEVSFHGFRGLNGIFWALLLVARNSAGMDYNEHKENTENIFFILSEIKQHVFDTFSKP